MMSGGPWWLELPWKKVREMVTHKKKLQIHAPGLTPKAVLEKLATIQMLYVWVPTTDGLYLIMSRYTQPEADQDILLRKLGLGIGDRE